MESWKHTSEGRSPFLCGEIGIENMEFRELGFHDMTRKSDTDNPSLGVSIAEIGNCFSGTLPSSTCDITSISSFEELESGLSFSSPFIVPNGRKSSPLDLKWGKLADWREAKNSRFSNGTSVISSVGSSMASKRARIVNLYSQNPICQVQGCNKDLSSSKDYHKRHKVCDVHSKTSMVVVNGIEQRFCQQCSRFHLLAEFDDGKRSCRKRLAGHNERRRKPQLDTLSGKSHNFLQYYEGARFLRTSLSKRTSFVFPDMLPAGHFSSRGNVRDSNCSHIKVEEESNSRPVFHLNGIGNLFPPGDFPLQAGYTFLETRSKVQELSGVSNSSSALSLLSAQSKNMSSHLTETPLGFHQNSEKYVGVSFEEKALPNGFCSSGLNSMGIGQVGSPVDFCGSGAAIDGSEVQATGILQRSNSVKFKDGPTVDLIQLSSHLERVEQQRNSMQVKQENDVFFYFPSM